MTKIIGESVEILLERSQKN